MFAGVPVNEPLVGIDFPGEDAFDHRTEGRRRRVGGGARVVGGDASRLECKSNTPMGIVRISITAAAARVSILYAMPE